MRLSIVKIWLNFCLWISGQLFNTKWAQALILKKWMDACFLLCTLWVPTHSMPFRTNIVSFNIFTCDSLIFLEAARAFWLSHTIMGLIFWKPCKTRISLLEIKLESIHFDPSSLCGLHRANHKQYIFQCMQYQDQLINWLNSSYKIQDKAKLTSLVSYNLLALRISVQQFLQILRQCIKILTTILRLNSTEIIFHW